MRQIAGFDVSHHNGVIDFGKAKAAGKDFVFVKATEFIADVTYAANRSAATKAGLHVGCYHFFHFDKDWAAQAHLFTQAVGSLKTGDLPPVLDLEQQDYREGKTGVSVIDGTRRALAWLSTVEAALHCAPIIYCDPDFCKHFLQDSRFAHYPLWLAAYQSAPPKVPAPFKRYTFWQNSEKGTVPGVGVGDVDLDLFNGTEAEFASLLYKPAPTLVHVAKAA